MSVRTSRLAGLALALAALAACSGSDEPDRTPEDVLGAARKHLDATEGVHLVLSTEALPEEVEGVLRADGVGTHAPGFEGTLTVVAGGIPVDVEVVAVNDVVHAQLPFSTEFVEIDPADYQAPDPAVLMDPDAGLSSLLTEVTGVTEEDKVRDGDEVLTAYAGTVPGEAVADVIPSASRTSDFDARFTVSDQDVLGRAELTGPFYPDAGDVTYTITFDEYGTAREITAP
jgi:lipoprotein LprG